MRPELAEAVAAFVDGEPADAALLAQALASDEGRTLLLDSMLLRAAVALDPSEDLQDLDRRVMRALAAEERPRFRAPVWAAAAAALLVLALGIGAALRAWRRGAAEGPPPATREITFTYGVDWRAQS
ncbi:MAG TPA: hypothetical protein VFV75_06870 [Candidatus Polarisedimenticolaceae bacterium]|nr:hypothetical protein [Candidatus Polarisedimenticolaceae bacterium]